MFTYLVLTIILRFDIIITIIPIFKELTLHHKAHREGKQDEKLMTPVSESVIVITILTVLTISMEALVVNRDLRI